MHVRDRPISRIRKYGSVFDYVKFLIQKTEENEGEMQWDAIIRAFERRRDCISSRTLEKVSALLKKALLRHRCEDREVIARFAEFFTRLLHDSRSTEVEWIVAPFRVDRLYPFFDVRQCEYITPYPRFNWKAVQLAMRSCDRPFMEVLMRYGLWNGTPDREDYMSWRRLCFFRKQICDRFRLQNLDFADLERWAEYTWNVLRLTDGSMYTDTKRGLRRIPLILRTLKAMTLTESEAPEEYVECMKVYFSAIPDPHVSTVEVLEFLHYMLREEHFDWPIIRWILPEWISVYVDLPSKDFDLSENCPFEKPYMPRSLAHLCRWKVRNLLVNNQSRRTLPCLVEHLEIPRELKNGLLCTPDSISW